MSSQDHIAERFDRQRAEREAKWAATSDDEILRMRIEESRGGLDPVTTAFLGLTVPMWIEMMRPWHPERRVRKGHELVELIAYEQAIAAMCDTEARGTIKPGGLTKAFNAIAQGLACLAYCPGGIVFAGHHWEAHS
jgi:hypothetical protein